MWAILILAVLSLATAGCAADHEYVPLDGDIIFQVSRSSQSAAIQCATKSEWSHMGLVFLRRGEPMVLEAVEPVRVVALADWIGRGVDSEFTVRRLKQRDDARMTAVVASLKDHRFLHRHYDKTFEWTDEKLYCSELVWKLYQEELGIELAPLERFGDFDLECEEVRGIIAQRWPDGPPLDMAVISPAAILNSPHLHPIPH